MNGKTFWKSDVQKAEKFVGGTIPRRAFVGNVVPKIVCESGCSIEFELCSPSFFRSRVVARCAMSVSEILRSRHQLLDVGLSSVHDTSGKFVAHLQMDSKVSCAPLTSIGISSLRENAVPPIPTFRNEFLAGEIRSVSAAKATECEKFIAEAEHVRAGLQAAVNLHRSLQLHDRPHAKPVTSI
jgi:hypothetical protein